MAIFNHNVFDNVRARVIVPSDGHILLQTPPNTTEGWTCPGGGLEPDESLAECATREVLEETGLHVTVLGAAFLREWVVPKYAAPAVAEFVRPVHGEPQDAASGFGLEVFMLAAPLAGMPVPRPEYQDAPRFEWVAFDRVPEMPVWPKELKWLCRRLAQGVQPGFVTSFVCDLESPWADSAADPFG